MEYKIEDGVSQSMLSCFIDCPIRSYYSLLGYGLPIHRPALQFGSLMHYMLEEYAFMLQTTNDVDCEKINRQRAIEEFRGRGDIDMEDFELAFIKCKNLLYGYTEKWGLSDINKNVVQPEKQFDIEFKGFRLRGMRDAIFRIKDKLWIKETKTTSGNVDESYEQKLNFDFQTMFYLVATEIEMGEKVHGILYDVIKKPSIRVRQTETLKDYGERLRKETIEKNDEYFGRYEIKINNKKKKVFKEELEMKLRLFADFVKNPYMLHNESACIKRWKCEYIQACSQGNLKGYVRNKVLFGELQTGEKTNDSKKSWSKKIKKTKKI